MILLDAEPQQAIDPLEVLLESADLQCESHHSVPGNAHCSVEVTHLLHIRCNGTQRHICTNAARFHLLLRSSTPYSVSVCSHCRMPAVDCWAIVRI